MAGSCDQKRRRIRENESEKNGGWNENEGKTEKEMGGLYQGGHGGSGSDGGGGTGSSKMEEEDPHRRPQLKGGKPAEEEENKNGSSVFRDLPCFVMIFRKFFPTLLPADFRPLLGKNLPQSYVVPTGICMTRIVKKNVHTHVCPCSCMISFRSAMF